MRAGKVVKVAPKFYLKELFKNPPMVYYSSKLQNLEAEDKKAVWSQILKSI